MTVTDWDTTHCERRYLGGLADAVLLKKDEPLTIKLLSRVTDDWFSDPVNHAIYLALFEASTKQWDPRARITATGVIRIAQALNDQNPALVQEAWGACADAAAEFHVDEWFEKERLLWWEKTKRTRIQELLAKADAIYRFKARADSNSEMEAYLIQALEELRRPPLVAVEETNLMNEHYELALEPMPAEAIIPTGMRMMDQVLGGGLSGVGAPSAGKLIIVTARPGAGKTQLCLNLGMRVALQGFKVAMWSLEMQPLQVHNRLFCAMDHMLCMKGRGMIGGKLTYSIVSNRKLNLHPELKKRWEANRPTEQALADSFKVMTGSVHSAKQIAEQMRVYARANPETRLFIIDHLGLLDLGDSSVRAVSVGEATRLIKTTAADLGIDVILVCQLNRAVENRADKMPSLSDLRDSGRIEEDADVVIGLHRPVHYDPEHDPLDLQIAILKNRQGSIGRFGVCIDNDCCAIYETQQHEYAEI